MEQGKQRNILLCVAGLTPQIITETLYVLTQQLGETVDEIRVITTLDGRDKIMTGIVRGRGRHQDSLLHPEGGQFYAFCDDFGIDPGSIKFDEKSIALLRTRDGLTLPDIRTPEENELAGDQIGDIVRELTRDAKTRIHASAAGGRKTMSIYLTAAMQLFGRANDSLSHVLVSEEFETHPEFFYIPPAPRLLKMRDGREVSTETAKIYLAPIPFIRLRGVKLDTRAVENARSYGEMVRNAQADLDYIESEYDLKIDLASYTVTVESRSVQLAPREMFFYALFAEARAESSSKEGILSLDGLKREDFDGTFRRLMKAQRDNVGIEECSSFKEFEFLQEMLDEMTSSKTMHHDSFKKKFVEVNSKINGKFKKLRLERYMIQLREERGTACYGLTVSPQRIKFLQAEE